MPPIGPNSETAGFGMLNVRGANKHYVALAFVGSSQELAAMGGLLGVEAHFRNVPLPSCAEEGKLR